MTALRSDGPRVRIAGRIADPLGRIPAGSRPSGTLELYDRRHPRRVIRIPADLAHRGERIEWRAAFDPGRRLRPVGFVDPLWDARLVLRANGERLTVRITAAPRARAVRAEGARPDPPGGALDPPGGALDAPGGVREGISGVRLPVRPRLTRLAGTHLRSYVTERGYLSFVLDGGGRLTGPSRAAVRRAARTPAGRLAWRGVRRAERSARRLRASVRRALTARRTKIAVSNRVLTRLPVRRGTVVFESHLGRGYSDNPKYIYRELRRSGAAVRAIWSYRGSAQGFPADATLVRRGSWAYFLALSRAEFWVDNQGFPEGLRKRAETTYIQTWHGSAYKRMGFDQPELKTASLAQQERFRRNVGRYDCFLVRTGHDERTLVPGMGVTAELIPVGYPRNDPLVNGRHGDPDLARELDALRRRLGLDGDGRTVVLYAPTFRKGEDGKPAADTVPTLDTERFAAELGGTQILLVRPHYLSPPGAAVPPGARRAVRDAGHVADVTPLLLLADALITDGSSVMFDYALLDRPMVFYAPYTEEESIEPGYFDLAVQAPGPVVRDEDALFAALAGLDAVRRDYGERRRAFAARYGEHDRGTAAEAVVRRFFGAGTGPAPAADGGAGSIGAFAGEFAGEREGVRRD
ncbi:CDP-glycerol glycerophosphotransferase family protein [Spirillospora sp. CA-255316]